MKKILFVVGVGLIPLWAVLVLTLIGLAMGEGVMALMLFGSAATVSAILLPIVLAATVTYSVIKGGAKRKWLMGGMVALACSGVATILVYTSKFASDKRAAAIDEQLALQLARESKEIAGAVGGVMPDIRIASVSDERLNRSFDFFAPRRESNESTYHIEANGTEAKSARVILRYRNGKRIFELECCQRSGTWSTPAPPHVTTTQMSSRE